jgi:hypothetical protein
MMEEKLVCLECGEEIHFDALVTIGGEIVTTYDTCICSNQDCRNSNEYAKYWEKIAIKKGISNKHG